MALCPYETAITITSYSMMMMMNVYSIHFWVKMTTTTYNELRRKTVYEEE